MSAMPYNHAVGMRAKAIKYLREQIYSQYKRKTPASAAMYDRAKTLLPGGVSGNLRHFVPYPFYMARGQGSKSVDIDGNEYIDNFSCNGPLLLGHNHPKVVEGIASVRDIGLLPFNPPIMVDCAELITQIIPCAERVRFLNTGTEAVMTAVRYARAYTSRNKIIRFHGHYHGQQDPFLFGLDATKAIFSDGVPQEALSGMAIFSYGEIELIKYALANDDDIAAIILDPAMHAGGLWGSSKGYLTELRQLTEQHDVVLIFDEVITGFRMAPGGAQEFFGVTPDLVTLAKAFAAGEKLAVVAGKEKVMRVVDPEAEPGTARVFQSGTVNDGSAALAAATAALKVYRELGEKGEYQRLAKRAVRLKAELIEAFTRRGIGCQVNQVASMLQVYLSREKVTFEMVSSLDMTGLELFYLALINEGIFLTVPTSNHIYLSFAHTESDIDLIVEKTNCVLDKYDFARVV